MNGATGSSPRQECSPNGTLDPFGAVPAAIAGVAISNAPFAKLDQAQSLDNEISTDGSRVFFVSPESRR